MLVITITDIFQTLRSSTAEAKELKSNIGRVFQQAVVGSAELAATQAKHWDATSSATVELQSSLVNLRENDIHSLIGAFDSIHSQLVCFSSPIHFPFAKTIQRASNELVAVMYSQQHEMDQVSSILCISITIADSFSAPFKP